MPTFIARLKRRPTHSPLARQHLQNHASPATPIRRPMPGAWAEMSPLDRRIHPDLNSLIIEDATPVLDIGPIAAPSIAQDDTALGFVPLPPSTRKRSTSLRIQPIEDADHAGQPSQDVSSRDAHDPLTCSTSFSESTSGRINTSSPNTSGETFGRAAKPTTPRGQRASDIVPDPCCTTPGTPDTSSSRSGNETSAHTPSHSSRSRSISSNKVGNITSSPHTFGIPTPPSSGFTFGSRRRRLHTSSETPPPLPPLDHPAFQSSSALSEFNNSRAIRIFTVPDLLLEKDDQPKQPRHVSSLPSMSRRALSSIKNHSRERARTQSRVKAQEIFSSTPLFQSTPRRRSRHSRTRSKDSISSSRRASAEFSSAQAALVGNSSGMAESWEAQVSREMVRISLGGKVRPGYQNNAGVAESGQACGSNVKPPIKILALGSPFLLLGGYLSLAQLKVIGTHRLTDAHDSAADNNTSGTNLMSSGNKGKSNIPTMSKDDTFTSSLETGSALGRAKLKSPERTRTPSPPPPKISTIPYPGPEAPSTSHLMPPSLSLTAPTPGTSPITPIHRTHHQPAATEPPQSVLKPKTPPAVKSTSSSHSGKRKADEAGVEGGNTTPPKDQPRATFALDPRPHRASAGSGSSRAAASGSSRAPSSYHRKRPKLSTTPESRPGSRASVDAQNAANTGSWSSKASSRQMGQPPKLPPATYQQPHRAGSRRSLSQASVHGSIPMSALISPHAPSIGGSSAFHMRDPRKPAPIQTTPWSLSLPSSGSGSWLDRGGSPLHAWLFFIGFLIFPIWWVAAFVGIPRTRRLGGNEVEKGVVLDDPQVEADATSWRKRCRIMAVVSLVTYVPFVVLVAIFA